MYGDDVSFQIVLVGGHMITQVAGEAPTLVHCLDVHSERMNNNLERRISV